MKKKLRTGCRILAERLDGLEEKYWKAVLPLDVIHCVMGMKGTHGLIFFSFEWS